MLKRFLQAVFVLLSLVALYLALLASEWWPRPTGTQRQAMDLLGQPLKPASGRSAFAVLWFLRYDLGDADPDEMLAQDVRRLAEHPGDPDAFRSVAADLPATALSENEACPGFPEPCLPEARKADSPGVALLAEHAVLVERARALRDTGHYRYPFGNGDQMQVPRLGRLNNLLRYANARRFTDGDAAGGLSDACQDLAIWRRLKPTANNLIQDMFAIAFAQAQSGLVSEMLAEWPAGQPLPASCELALAPLAAPELDQCDTWRGEWAFVRGQYESGQAWSGPQDPSGASAWLRRVVVNQRHDLVYATTTWASGCSAHRLPAASPEPRLQEWIFDPVGTVMNYSRNPESVTRYMDRHDDYLDSLRALRLQAWLREQPDLAAAWANPPADHLPLPAGLALDLARRELSLQIRRSSPEGPDHWLLPLPPPLPARPPAG